MNNEIVLIQIFAILFFAFIWTRYSRMPAWYGRLRRTMNIIGFLIFLVVAAIVFIALNKPV